MATLTLRPADGSNPVQFTYEGTTLGDGSPAAAVLGLMIAQCEQDRAKCLQLLSASSRAMVPPDAAPPPPFFGDVTFQIADVAVDGARATVAMTMQSPMMGDQPLPSTMVCVQEEGTWRVDLMATMELMMSSVQGGLGTVQEGLGQLEGAVGDLEKLLADMRKQTPGTGAAEAP